MYIPFSVIPAPKYQSLLEHMDSNCLMVANSNVSEMESSIRIAPNPTTGLIRLEGVALKISISVYDALGVLRQNSKNVQSLDLSIFPKGVYFIAVQVNGASRMLKVVLE